MDNEAKINGEPLAIDRGTTGGGGASVRLMELGTLAGRTRFQLIGSGKGKGVYSMHVL